MKSLTTDEIGLNDALEAAGISALETDLAELIIQLGHDSPSHILVPAIHRNRAEVRDLFARTIAAGRELSDDPRELAEAARLYLRERFLDARVGISGANFGVAETGTICVRRVGGQRPHVHDAPAGAGDHPRHREAGAAPGGPRGVPAAPAALLDGRAHEPLHVAVDRGARRRRAAGAARHPARQRPHATCCATRWGGRRCACIRCSACLNVCPVYERVGGHAYGSVYPGPIGAILTPQLEGMERFASLPFASSLCGACYEVCPVKIDIPSVLLHLRGVAVRAKASPAERAAFGAVGWLFRGRRRFALAQRLARVAQRPLLRRGLIHWLPGPLGGWTRGRDLRPVARESFREWWSRERGA